MFEKQNKEDKEEKSTTEFGLLTGRVTAAAKQNKKKKIRAEHGNHLIFKSNNVFVKNVVTAVVFVDIE